MTAAAVRDLELMAMIDHLRDGKPAVLLDRHGSGDFVVAADAVDADAMAMLIELGSGFVQVALSGEACDRLHLPPMAYSDRVDHYGLQCVGVDAADGVTTGISAQDRATTARVLADPSSSWESVTRPGHVVPLRARSGSGHFGVAEAAVAVSELAGRAPAAVLCSIVSRKNPCDMADFDDLTDLARHYGLPLIDPASLFGPRLTNTGGH